MSLETARPKTVLCLSGGMDSCVCAALAARESNLYAVHFSYGQRTEARELASAREIARLVGAKEFLPLRIDLFRRIGGSALTDSSIAGTECGGARGFDRLGYSSDVRAFSQRAFPLGRGELGGGAGG